MNVIILSSNSPTSGASYYLLFENHREIYSSSWLIKLYRNELSQIHQPAATQHLPSSPAARMWRRAANQEDGWKELRIDLSVLLLCPNDVLYFFPALFQAASVWK